MIDRQLQSLKDAPVPTASEAAKTHALAAAMAAFASANASTVAASTDQSRDTQSVVAPGLRRDDDVDLAVRPLTSAPARVGPRPFVLRHSYKIAASLAALAVIGPMLALLRAPETVTVENRSAKMTAKQAAELPLAPPVVLAQPPTRDTARIAVPAKPPAAPAEAADARAAPSGAPALPTQPAPPAVAMAPTPRAQSAPDAKAAPHVAKRSAPLATAPTAPAGSQPAASDCPPGRACVTMTPNRSRSLIEADIGYHYSTQKQSVAAATRWKAVMTWVAYPSLPTTALVVSTMPAPWSDATTIVHLWFAPSPSDVTPSARTFRVGAECGGQAGGADRFITVNPAEFNAGNPNRRPGIVTVWEETSAARPAKCSSTIQNDGAASDTRYDLSPKPYASLAAAPDDIRFGIAIARLSDLINGTAANAAAFGYDETIALAEGAKGADPSGERAELIVLMRKAKERAR